MADPAHTRFSEAVESIRPELHRYCARMTGSALDGEDLVQETLAQAYYRLTLSREEPALRPWLFTIAHHKCVDYLRSRSATAPIELDEANEPAVEIDVELEIETSPPTLSRAWCSSCRPKSAAVVLKEVLGYSLPEIAKILETSVGGVKAALHRGREKLVALAEPAAHAPEAPGAAVAAYIEAFNRRDWVTLQALFEDEVRCELVGHVHHVGRKAIESNYFANYSKLPYPWKLAAGEVDGAPAILCLREQDGRWTPHHAVRLDWRAGQVAQIRDYVHVKYVLDHARIALAEPPPSPAQETRS